MWNNGLQNIFRRTFERHFSYSWQKKIGLSSEVVLLPTVIVSSLQTCDLFDTYWNVVWSGMKNNDIGFETDFSKDGLNNH